MRRCAVLILSVLTMASAAHAAAPSGCQTMAEVEATADGHLAKTIPSPADRVKGKAAAKAVIADLDDLQRRFVAGERLGEPYTVPTYLLTAAKAATDPRIAELLRRMAQDQFVRSHFTALASGAAWAQSLSPAATGYLRAFLLPLMCETDAANTAWMKREIDSAGWFVISKYGEQADGAAFLIVQHADRDPAFQAEVLALLADLRDKGETRPSSYAYLYDRVAVAQKRPQRYATQGGCTAPGVWTPRAYEHPSEIDKVRASVGLMTLAEYAAGFKDLCRAGPSS
jgi:hypothetical protein